MSSTPLWKLKCPVCGAAFRGPLACPRCGTDLTMLATVSARAWMARRACRQALLNGDLTRAVRSASIARRLQR